MALGVLLTVVSLVLPRVAGLAEPVYSGVCAGILALGSLLLTVRGWRLANRLLRERRRPPGTA